jgi:hypothetical protein
MLTCAVAAVAACSPEIISGAYLCGPEQLCPEGQACNGVNNTCVSPENAKPFSCPSTTEVEPNDSAASAQPIPNLTCVTGRIELTGCAPADDPEDWYSFDVPATCGTTIATISLAFPVAFEQLSLQLAGADAQAPTEGSACDYGTTDDGTDSLCLRQPVTAGGYYTVRIARTGVGSCGGACSFNRYAMAFQLGTP